MYCHNSSISKYTVYGEGICLSVQRKWCSCGAFKACEGCGAFKYLQSLLTNSTAKEVIESSVGGDQGWKFNPNHLLEFNLLNTSSFWNTEGFSNFCLAVN